MLREFIKEQDLSRFGQIKFQSKAMMVLGVTLFLVLVTGYFAYNKFSGIVHSVTRAAKPDLYLITAKNLAAEIQEAENYVKSYRLTEDTIYVYKFYRSIKRAEDQLTELRKLEESNPHFDQMDYFVELIEFKFTILNELIKANKVYRVQEALNKASSRIANETNPDTAQEISSKMRIINKFLSKLRTEESKKKVEDVALADIHQQMEWVREEEQYIEESIKSKERELIEKDQLLSGRLVKILDDIEKQELQKLEQKKREANDAMRKTNLILVFFFLAITALLMLMAYLTIRYIKSNNAYKRALRRARKETEKLAKAKERFLANVSHEIRTPIHAIAGFTEQLATTRLNKDQKEQVEVIQNSIEHILFLVNDVLDYSKLKAGKLKLESIPFRPYPLIEECLKLTSAMAREKGLDLQKDLEFTDNLILRGDSHRLTQVLINLITNAIKFTSKGHVKVSARAMRKEDQTALELIVEDTGSGMSREEISRIFEAFEQADASITRTYGGTGLGLSIVKELVELQKGRIYFRSEKGKGTSVILTIPYASSDSTELRSIRRPGHLSQFAIPQMKELTALVVDDEVYNRKLIAAILDGRGIAYELAEDGFEALKHLEKGNFDFILMDTHMPNLNGIDACMKIREMEDEHKKNTPIIALTAAISQANQEMYKKVGMNSFLAKPFREIELLQCIAQTLNLQIDIREESKAETDKKNSKLIDMKELRDLSAGNAAFYEDMLKTFITGTEDGFKKLKNLMAKEDWYLTSEYAHKMCAPCRHLKAYQLHEVLKDIEETARNNPDKIHLEQQLAKAVDVFKKIKKIVNEELVDQE